MKPRLPQGKQVARPRRSGPHPGQGQSRQPGAGNQAMVNVTDPDSRLMTTPTGWAQAYNAQAVVNYIGIIVAADVSCDPNDMALFRPMVAGWPRRSRLSGPSGWCWLTPVTARRPTWPPRGPPAS